MPSSSSSSAKVRVGREACKTFRPCALPSRGGPYAAVPTRRPGAAAVTRGRTRAVSRRRVSSYDVITTGRPREGNVRRFFFLFETPPTIVIVIGGFFSVDRIIERQRVRSIETDRWSREERASVEQIERTRTVGKKRRFGDFRFSITCFRFDLPNNDEFQKPFRFSTVIRCYYDGMPRSTGEGNVRRFFPANNWYCYCFSCRLPVDRGGSAARRRHERRGDREDENSRGEKNVVSEIFSR